MEVSVPETSWEHGRFDGQSGPQKLLFGRMYEDANIEQQAFRRGSRVFCIASAGCTAMQLARHHEVVAVDINPVQVRYAADRSRGHPAKMGSAEKLLGLFRKLGVLAGWSKPALRAFLELGDPEQQLAYWNQCLNTRRFRAGSTLLFSLIALRAVYSAGLLDQVPSNLGAVMRRRMERCFRRHPNHRNSYARSLLLGQNETGLPLAEKHDIQFACADAASYLESQPAGGFDGFTLSNILDGANSAYAGRLLKAVKRAAAPGATLVLRSFREPAESGIGNIAEQDRAMIWGVVLVEPVAKLAGDFIFSNRKRFSNAQEGVTAHKKEDQ